MLLTFKFHNASHRIHHLLPAFEVESYSCIHIEFIKGPAAFKLHTPLEKEYTGSEESSYNMQLYLILMSIITQTLRYPRYSTFFPTALLHFFLPYTACRCWLMTKFDFNKL
jgi:hypothetical protein